MALDKNLFTLSLEPSKIEPSAIDLVDPSGTIHYRKRLLPSEAGTYLISLSDPLSDSILATAAAPAATSKEKVIELHNPSVVVPLAFKGTLTFKWTFPWEEHSFEWKREACYMVRKPDPPVLVAVTKEPAGKIKTSTVQILDYNLNRFDIEDRKGLEIVLLTSLLTFGDQSEQQRARPSNDVLPTVVTVPPAGEVVSPPLPPPKPEGWKEDQIAILQAKEQRDVNEVVIGEIGSIDEYVKHCVSLLEDDTLLFITLRSLTPSCVSKVVQVAEATKRTRYKDSGYDDGEELHQYVDMAFDANAGKGMAKGKGPRVINLDDRPSAPASTYQPPNTLTIHLSKIAMPELEPKTNKPKSSRSPAGSSSRHTKMPSEPVDSEASTAAKSKKQGWRQSSAGTASLAPPSQGAPTPSSPSSLFGKLSALTSRSSESSPPPGSAASRPSPSPSQPPSPPVQPQSQSIPRPERSPQPIPPQPRAPSQLRLSKPQQQPRPQASPTNIMPPQHSYPPPGRGRPTNSQPSTVGFTQQTPVYPPRPMPAGPVSPYPGPMNAPPENFAYAMYPGLAGAPPLPPQQQQPQQKASGKGFFSRR